MVNQIAAIIVVYTPDQVLEDLTVMVEATEIDTTTDVIQHNYWFNNLTMKECFVLPIYNR